MNGIFQAGPTIEPLFQIYLTVENVSADQGHREPSRGNKRTLIVCDKYQESGKSPAPSVHTIEDLSQNTRIVQSHCCRKVRARMGRGKAAIDCSRHVVGREVGRGLMSLEGC